MKYLSRTITLCLGMILLLVPQSQAAELRGQVVDAATGQPLAARVYLQRLDDGSFQLVRAAYGPNAVPYDRRNWVNPRSYEKHTCVGGVPFVAEKLTPGRYRLTVERGKEYFPAGREVVVGEGPVQVKVALRRWVNMAEQGWYSGETHIHRTLEELPLLLQAEDLNVAFPLTFWVTRGFTAPSAGDRNLAGKIPDKLIAVDSTHVIWPRNTEYEIFTVGEKRHTLGALFVLNHRSILDMSVPPWSPIARKAQNEGALLDMDKLDWPFAMILPPITGATLYELANNHLWRTDFAFEQWNSLAPPFLQPPRGGKSGNERQWLHYTLGMYYVLLDAGFRLVPTAGTANGVHPVPVGFSRVYVHLPRGFSYQSWLDGLRAGRSFATTGPMLFARVNNQQPGTTVTTDKSLLNLAVQGQVLSEHPLANLEVVVNGQVVQTIKPQNCPGKAGHTESSFSTAVEMDTSGWLCLRAFEDRPDGRVRFAHTAPWWIEIAGRPLRPRREEKEYLIQRVQEEITRSQGIVPQEALAEYQKALAHFQGLETRP